MDVVHPVLVCEEPHPVVEANNTDAAATYTAVEEEDGAAYRQVAYWDKAAGQDNDVPVAD
jgi:hypothetical protein